MLVLKLSAIKSYNTYNINSTINDAFFLLFRQFDYSKVFDSFNTFFNI